MTAACGCIRMENGAKVCLFQAVRVMKRRSTLVLSGSLSDPPTRIGCPPLLTMLARQASGEQLFLSTMTSMKAIELEKPMKPALPVTSQRRGVARTAVS